ncbi:MAG: hypothetical protein KBD90_04030 [Alphaproteobacteria bacterium]|nr:hypothetical protein [Alphaproteobacteria bacterium]
MKRYTDEGKWIQFMGVVKKTLCHFLGEKPRNKYGNHVYEPYGKTEKAIDQEINAFIDSI